MAMEQLLDTWGVTEKPANPLWSRPGTALLSVGDDEEEFDGFDDYDDDSEEEFDEFGDDTDDTVDEDLAEDDEDL